MTEAKVSSKTPATTAKKNKGDKERDVITRIKDVLPQWEIQKVEAFCAEHNHDLDKIHAALDGSFERTGHQPDDWQVMTKKEQKPKRGGGGRTEGGSREPRDGPRTPREDRPRGERGERGGRGRGGGESRGRGRGGGDRRGGRGGGGARSKDNATTATTVVDTTAPTEPSTTETWGVSDSSAQSDAKPETTAEWGASSSPVAVVSTPTPVAVASISLARVLEPTEKKMSWADKFSATLPRKTKITELQSAEAFPPQQTQQVLGPAVVHVQPLAPSGPSYRAALQGNSRWGKKADVVAVEPVVDTSMVPIEQQTASLVIDSFQPVDASYAQVDDTPQNTATSDVLNSIPDTQETVTSSFPQAEVFQPEASFESQPQTDSFQIYNSQNQPPSIQNVVSDPKAQAQSAVYSQVVSTPDFNDLRAPQSFSPDNSGKLVIDMLSATNSVILPHASQETLSYEIQFGSFGQPAPTNFAPVQPEPIQQPEPKPVPVVQQQQPLIEPTPTESQPQLSQQSFVSTLREDSLPTKQTAVDNSSSSSQFPAQNQFYQSQGQPQAVPPPSQSQSQPQPASGYRGPPPSGSYDPHYAYPFPYESASPYYNDFASRDTPQSYQNYNDQYSSQFRGGAAGGSGGGRRPTTNTNQPFYPSPTARGGLLGAGGPTDGSTGSTSPPTSEPVSPNSAKSASFSSKPANFAASNKPSFNTATKIPPQIPPYTTKPAGLPAAHYNKPPAAAAQPTQKSFKPPAQPQGAQSQHHPDPQHYMYPPGVYAGYPYPYPYQQPGQPMPPGFMHPQMPYAPYDPRYAYPYPGPVQPFEGEYDYSNKPPAHYSEGGTTPRGAGEWSGNTDGQKPSNNASAPSANAPSANTLPMNSAKNTVAPGANKKPTRFEYEQQQDPHYNSAYGFPGAPASSPMAMHAAAAPYQPASYGQPILHAMGGQAPYGGQYETHPRGGYAGGSWQ